VAEEVTGATSERPYAPAAQSALTWTIALPATAACLYLVVAPNFDLVGFADVYDERRLEQLGLLVLVAIVLMTSRRARMAWLGQLASMPAWMPVILGTLAARPATAFVDLALYVLLFVATTAVAAAFADMPDRMQRLTVAALLTGASLFLIDASARYLAARVAGSGAPPMPRDLLGRFSTVRFFSQWQTWTLPLIGSASALLVPGGRPNRLVRAGVVIVAAGWWTLLFVSGTRGTLLGEAVAYVLVALLWAGVARGWLAQQLSLAGFGLLIYLAAYVLSVADWGGFLASFGHVASLSDSGRREIWIAALALVREHPLLGVGPGHYAFVDGIRNAHPHNVVLQWACEWGLPSTCALVAVVGAGAARWLAFARYRLVKDPDAGRRGLVLALTASLTAAAVHAQLSGIAVMPLSQVLGVVIVGWCWGIVTSQRTVRVRRASPAAEALLVATVVAAGIAVGYGAWPSQGTAWFAVRPAGDGTLERFRPRFWRRTEPLEPAAAPSLR